MKCAHKNPVIFFFLIFLSSVFVSFESECSAGSTISPQDRKHIFVIIDEEFSHIKEDLIFVKKNKEAVWATADLEFSSLWLEGLEKEKKSMFAEATKFYEKAYKVERYEMSSYEVLLPLGRAYLLNGEKDKALYALEEFLKEAESELSSLRPWEFTPEGEQALRKNMERAEWLIDLCR